MSRGIHPGGGVPRKPDFKDAEEAHGECGQNHHHEGDETCALELHAPARGPAAGLDGGDDGGQHPKTHEDSRRRGSSQGEEPSATFTCLLNQAEQLKRKHRQHARHQVQDNSADKSEEQQRQYPGAVLRSNAAAVPRRNTVKVPRCIPLYLRVVFFCGPVQRTVIGCALYGKLAGRFRGGPVPGRFPVKPNRLACRCQTNRIVARLVVERHLGSEAVVARFRTVAVLRDALYRDFDGERPAECQNFKFQRLVVFPDGGRPHGIAEFYSFRLDFN